MSESDQWMRDHKGHYLYSWGFVWECGDYECGCTQAQVVDYFENRLAPKARVPVTAWSGEFRSEHEPGADADLAAYRRALRESAPAREAAIQWQKGVDYAAHPKHTE